MNAYIYAVYKSCVFICRKSSFCTLCHLPPLPPDPLKLALAVEAKAWKTAYGHSLNARYRSSMENIVQFVTEYSKRLSRSIKVRT